MARPLRRIASIPSDLSSRFGELRELDLSHCRLSDIDEPVWPAESKLRALHLNGNQMTLLVNDTFANLDSLDYLDIQDLDLREIDVGGTVRPVEAKKNASLDGRRLFFWDVATGRHSEAASVADLPGHRQLLVGETVPAAGTDRELAGAAAPRPRGTTSSAAKQSRQKEKRR